MTAKVKAVPDQPQTSTSRVEIEGRPYEFDWSRLMSSEARFIQRVTGLTVAQFGDGVKEGNADCLVAFYALLRHRAEEVALKTIEDLDDDRLDFDLGSFRYLEEKKSVPTKEEPGSSDSAPPAVA